MDKRGKKFQLSYPSRAEVKLPFRMEVIRLSGRHEFKGSALSDGDVVNALLYWFPKQPESERDRIAREALRLFEDLEIGREVDCQAKAEAQSGRQPIQPAGPTAHFPVVPADPELNGDPDCDHKVAPQRRHPKRRA